MAKKLLIVILVCCWSLCGAHAQGGLTISELLFQPRSGEAEYVELHNPTSVAIDLAHYAIVRWVGDSLGKRYPLPSHEVAAGDYVVLTKDAASVATNYTVRFPSKVVECSLPTYPNDGGSVILARADGELVERLDYSPAMHSRLLRNKAGVALERRSMEHPCNEASNWFSAASTAGYGTPGYANSQSTEWLVEEASFNFSSTLLSPDGDGYQDELEVSYRLDRGDLTATMAVYDARGMQVRRLLNGDLLGTHGEIRWDGRGEGGSTLPLGRYVVHMVLYDSTGTQQTLRRVVSLVTR